MFERGRLSRARSASLRVRKLVQYLLTNLFTLRSAERHQDDASVVAVGFMVNGRQLVAYELITKPG